LYFIDYQEKRPIGLVFFLISDGRGAPIDGFDGVGRDEVVQRASGDSVMEERIRYEPLGIVANIQGALTEAICLIGVGDP
jgi:hypothetical protein